ncbi:hypothetical protein PM082_023182 [Marasmius tenuissimus]|nr:hypothetical protein PM082_023182 [Marasmius tenuissimus]
MTGFLDCACFSAVVTWCGSQSGVFIQLAVALARLLEGPIQARTPPSTSSTNKLQPPSTPCLSPRR